MEASDPAGRYIIDTASGMRLDLDDPQAEDIRIEHVAGGLSKVCRFGAQARESCSVAQHALLVQRLVVEAGRPELALAALHYDSHEACNVDSQVNPRLLFSIEGRSVSMAFGEEIRELRKAQKMSQRELANQSGIDFTYLSKIENNRIEPPSEDVIRRVAQALGADADELIVLADKLPSDLARELKTPERVKALRRELAGDFNSVEDFRKAFGRP